VCCNPAHHRNLGKAAFYGGRSRVRRQEGIQSDGVEFKIVGHDASLSKPEFMSSISAFLNDKLQEPLREFLAKKTASDTVTDQNGQALRYGTRPAMPRSSLPGNTGDTLEITGVLDHGELCLRLRSDLAIVSAATLPTASGLSSRVDPQLVNGEQRNHPECHGRHQRWRLQSSSRLPTRRSKAERRLTTAAPATTSTFRAAIPAVRERARLAEFDLSSIPAGSIITGATLQCGTGRPPAHRAVEVRSAANDSWTETGVNWSNQPAPGNVSRYADSRIGHRQRLVQLERDFFRSGRIRRRQDVSLVLKPVTGRFQPNATSPSYGFDAREYGSNAPVLHVTTASDCFVGGQREFLLPLFCNNTNWGAWTQVAAADTVAPYTAGFSFPNGQGYYEFYSVATDNLGGVEATPAYAQSAVHYQAASGSSQSISFTQPADAQAGTGFAVSATATSGLPVTFSSQNPGICSVSAVR